MSGSAGKSRMFRYLMAGSCVVLAAGCIWLWSVLFERSSDARPYVAKATIENHMLAATRLLEKHGYQVRIEKRLGSVDLAALPGGMLVLADSHGQVTGAQAPQILAWVKRGNTLIMQPHWAPPEDSTTRSKPVATPDPIGAYLGVGLSYASKMRANCDGAPGNVDDDDDTDDTDDDDAPNGASEASPAVPNTKPASNPRQLTCVLLPKGAYPLSLDTGTEVLSSIAPARAPLWSDYDGKSVRVFAEGDGHIAMISDNYFNNQLLPRQDHAELLLGLAAMKQGGSRDRNVLIVLQGDAVPWYVKLWQAAAPLLIALATLLPLLLWRAASRFGPMLPDPAGERRALLEHIDASGNWLWRAGGGRDVLLAAARQETAALLRRRAPELQPLTEDEQAARLARLCGAGMAELRGALYGPAATHPAAFTRQIQLLQQVRNQYERQ
jgi:hypothetical protein